jgi:hypothetical protein
MKQLCLFRLAGAIWPVALFATVFFTDILSPVVVSMTAEDLGTGIRRIDLVGARKEDVYQLKPVYVDSR